MVAYWYLQIKGFLWSTGVSDELNEARTSDERGVGRGVRRPVLLVLLGVIVAAEALVMAGVTLWLVLELLTVRPASYETALAILVLTAIAAIFLVFVAVHTFRMRPWTRAATLTWQILQVVIAVAAFQGIVASPEAGWYLLISALIAVALLFAPPVVAVTRRA